MLKKEKEGQYRLSKARLVCGESDNQSKMINASRAFRNLPPEFVMNSSESSGKK